MEDSLKELSEALKKFKECVILATVEAKKYAETNMKIIKHLVEDENIPGVYVTLNKPYATIKEELKKNGIDPNMIIFIDAVTKVAGGEIKKEENCLFIGNPENLSDISVAMDQAVTALPGEKKFVFFDSLSTLLVYNKPQTVAKFIHFLASKMRVWKVKGIIISLQKEEDKELIDFLSQICDLTIELGVNE